MANRSKFHLISRIVTSALDVFPPRLVLSYFSATNVWREWFIVWKHFFGLSSQDPQKIIADFETEFAHASKTKYAVSFGSGRMALYAIIKSLDLKAGDEIILPAYTCVVVPNAFIYAGCVPIYIDISLDDFNINPGLIEASITQKTKAIYIQHTFGIPAQSKQIKEIAIKHGLLMIEDCAHSPIGYAFDDGVPGTTGDASFFSTDRTKYISTLLGGVAVTDSVETHHRLKAIQNSSPDLDFWPAKRIQLGFLLEFPLTSPLFYWLGRFFMGLIDYSRMRFYFLDEMSVKKPSLYPYPCKMAGFQAEVGLSQLSLLPEIISSRCNLFAFYRDQLKPPFRWMTQACLPLLRFPFYVTDRQKLDQFVYRWSDCAHWFTSPFQGRVTDFSEILYKPGQCPNAELAAKHVYNLPMNTRSSHLIHHKSILKNLMIVKESISNKFSKS